MSIMNLLQISFYSAFVSCGLAVMRNTRARILPYIYLCAFSTAFVFNGLNSVTYTFIAGIAAGAVAAVLVGISHRKGIHSYLFIVIPVVYCIGPGGAMYKLALSVLNGQFTTIASQVFFIISDAFGIWCGIMLGTSAMNAITKQKSEKF